MDERPLTTNQTNLLHNMLANSEDLIVRGDKSLLEASELRAWISFDTEVIVEIEDKYEEITKLAEDISELVRRLGY